MEGKALWWAVVGAALLVMGLLLVNQRACSTPAEEPFDLRGTYLEPRMKSRRLPLSAESPSPDPPATAEAPPAEPPSARPSPSSVLKKYSTEKLAEMSPEELERLEGSFAEGRRSMDSFFYEHWGYEEPTGPLEWPGGSPPSGHTNEAFTNDLEDVLAACDLDIELLAADCTEVPCIAVLVSEDSRHNLTSLQICPAYQSAFGSRATKMEFQYVCPDGRFELLMFLSPFVEDDTLLSSVSTDIQSNDDITDIVLPHWHWRRKALMYEWSCAGY